MTATQNGHYPTIPAAPGFGQALRDARENAGLSQAKAARAIGCDHSYVNRLETGMRTPTRDMVQDIGYALKLPDRERIGLYVLAGFIPPNMDAMYIETHGKPTLIVQAR